MEIEYIGKIVSTHGIKGELKILSDFPYKDKVFKENKNLLIDNKNYIIKTYRHHKIYDMVTLNDFNSINEVEYLIGKKVYIEKSKLNLAEDEILDSDLKEFKIKYEKKEEIGKIIEIFMASPTNKIVKFKLDNKYGSFPLNNKNINIDKKKRVIYLKKEEVIFNED